MNNIFDRVKRTLRFGVDHGVEMEVRTTIAQGLTDDSVFVKEIATSIRDSCDTYCLQQFDNLGDILSPELKSRNPPARECMIKLSNDALATGVKNVYVRTRKNGIEKIG